MQAEPPGLLFIHVLRERMVGELAFLPYTSLPPLSNQHACRHRANLHHRVQKPPYAPRYAATLARSPPPAYLFCTISWSSSLLSPLSILRYSGAFASTLSRKNSTIDHSLRHLTALAPDCQSQCCSSHPRNFSLDTTPADA